MDVDLVIAGIIIVLIIATIGATINGVVQKVLDYKRDKNRLALAAEQAGNPEIAARLSALESFANDRGAMLSDKHNTPELPAPVQSKELEGSQP